jgi:hypothetical protein
MVRYKRYTQPEKEKRSKKYEVKSIKIVKGSYPVVKSIEEKKSLVPPPPSCGLQNFDHLFPSKDTTLGSTELSSTLLHS